MNRIPLALASALLGELRGRFLNPAWLRPLMLPDEGRYVGVAWSVLTSSDWLTPPISRATLSL